MLALHTCPSIHVVRSQHNEFDDAESNESLCMHSYLEERNIDAALFDVTDSSSLFIDKGID